MRLNVKTGAWKCMNCGASGSDVLAYHQAVHSLDFIEAAKALGAWDDAGAPETGSQRGITARDALLVLRQEITLCAVAAGNLARGVQLSDADRQRLLKAARRVEQVGALV